jgi:hypothetical protein
MAFFNEFWELIDQDLLKKVQLEKLQNRSG